jgi:subtilisin-like proprotein convertase family protein
MALRGATFGRSRLLLHAAVVLVLLAVCAAAPGAAQASPAVGHVSTDASADGGGPIVPGSTISLNETINNSGDPLTGASGLLTSTTPGVDVTQASSAYPDLTFGQEGSNTAPFAATVAPSVPCGTPLAFSLQIDAADSYSQAVPFTVPTGLSGPATPYNAADLPTPIPDNANILSGLSVGGGGLAKGITVHLGQIDHTYDQDLKIELIAPDGKSVVLVNRRGGGGNNFTNTVLSDTAGQSIASGTAPFTGSYRPEEPLSGFDGHAVAGTWQLKVSDQSSGDTGVIKAWGADIAPAVCTTDPVAGFTANPNPAVPGAAVNFDASGSVEPKPGTTIDSYEWDFGDGTQQTTSTPTVSHSYATRGAYQATLVVTDSASDTSAPTNVSLIVTQPPTVTLGALPNPQQDGSPVTLTATAGDPDPGGSIDKYEWDLNGDGSFETDTGATSSTSTTFPGPGMYTVRVRVTDADGATAVAAITVNVEANGATNLPPVASLTVPSLAVAGQPVTLDAGGSSDPDGTVTQYEWDFNHDGVYDQTTTTPTVSHTFPGPAGQVTVGLRVTDNSTSTDTTTAKVNVVLAPTPGTLSASLPNAVPLNTPITFTDTGASDPNSGGAITKYEWDLDGNGTFEQSTATTPTASHSYGSNGTRSVKVRVTNTDGVTAVATYTLVALNQPPAISSLTASPNPAVVGQTVTLTAAAADPEGHGIARYDWDLDGNGGYETPSGASPTISYAYPNAGPIPVGVRVTDADGGQSTTTVTLQVNEGPGGAGAGAGTGSGGAGSTVAAGGTVAGSTGSTGSVGATPPNLRAGLLGLVVQRAATVRRRGLAVACRTNRAASCAVTVEVSVRDARRYGLRARRPVVLGTGSGSATVGRDARLSLRLNAAGRRVVARARTVSLLVRGMVRDRQGGRVPVTRVIRVKR